MVVICFSVEMLVDFTGVAASSFTNRVSRWKIVGFFVTSLQNLTIIFLGRLVLTFPMVLYATGVARIAESTCTLSQVLMVAGVSGLLSVVLVGMILIGLILVVMNLIVVLMVRRECAGDAINRYNTDPSILKNGAFSQGAISTGCIVRCTVSACHIVIIVTYFV